VEIILVLFILSGQFKSFLIFFGVELPIDLTLLIGVLVVLMMGYKMLKSNHFNLREAGFTSLVFLLLFYAWMVFSLLYTRSESYSKEKTLFFLLNIAAFAVPFLYRDFNGRRFIRLFALAVLVLALGLLPFQYFNITQAVKTSAEGEMPVIAGLYLSLSGFLGLLVVLLLTSRERVLGSRRWDIILAFGCILLMLLLSARAPLLFSLGIWLLYYLFNLKEIRLGIKTRTLALVLVGFTCLVVVLVVMIRFDATHSLLSRTFNRFVSLFTGSSTGDGMDLSAQIRINMYKDALHGIFGSFHQFLTGFGVGSFGIVTYGQDIRLYPHNIILEIWFELGLIGLILFTLWLVYLFLSVKGHAYRWISYWLLFYFFLNLMKSSSLVDIRTEFAFMGLFIAQFYKLNESTSSD